MVNFARRKAQWVFVSLLTLAVLILFWPALLNPSLILFPTFSPFSDVMVIHWPKANLMAQSWQAGDGLPLWTPLILSGMPLAANQLAMLFYPPAWLFLILPIEPVFNFLFVFHLLLGGTGVYLLLHKAHGLSPGAALLGGLTFALNGKWLAHAAGGHVSMVGAVGWLAWALFGLMMLLKQPGSHRPGKRKFWDSGYGWSLIVAIALSMQIFTHTLLLIYTVYLLAAVVAWHFLFLPGSGPATPRRRLTEFKRLWLPLLAIPILAGLLGAVQLLPLLELSAFSNRTLSLAEAAEYALTPTQLIVGLLLPSGAGGHELVIYLGLASLLLASFGLTGKKRWSWFYGLLFVFTVLFALGPVTPIHSLFYHLVPGFRWVRTPARIFFVGTVAVAALVGFGADNLVQREWSAKAKRWLARLAVALGALALLTGLGLAFGFDQLNRAALALAIIIPAGLALILLWTRRVISTSVATTLLGFLLFLDLASFDLSMMQFVPPDEALAPGRLAAGYLAPKPGLFRIYSPSYSLPMQTSAAARLQLADGVEPVHLAEYDQFMARAGGYNDPSFSVTIPNFGEGPLESALRYTEPNLKLLGLLNVGYLASAFPMDWPGLSPEAEIDGTYLYRNEHALPRAWVAHQVIPAEPDWLTQLESLPELGNVAVVENVAPAHGSTDAPTPVTITSYSANLIGLETDIAEPGWLVVSEIWYPGWQVSVNSGAARPVEKVNGLLRGLHLSQPGQYQIKLEYRPNSIVWGRRISGLTAGLVILAVAGSFIYRRWPR